MAQGEKEYPTFNQILQKYKEIKKIEGKDFYQTKTSMTIEELLVKLNNLLGIDFKQFVRETPVGTRTQYVYCNYTYSLNLIVDVLRVKVLGTKVWTETVVESFNIYSDIDLLYGECPLEDPEVTDV